MGPQVTVVVGVDGAGRTRRLDELAAAVDHHAIRINPPIAALPELGGAALVLVDDAHRLAPEQLTALAAAARAGVAVVIARRPSIASRELAELDEAVAGQGVVQQLPPIDVDGVVALCTAVTGARPTPEEAARVHRMSGGLPAVAVAVAATPAGTPSPALVARVQRRLAMLPSPVAELARLLALGAPSGASSASMELPDGVLRAASTMDDAAFAAGMRTLRDEGLLAPASESMIPALAEALLVDLAAAERRRTHEAVARALVAQGSDVIAVATQLRAARAYIPAAASAYAGAGDRVRFDDPNAAIAWYDDAIESGADPAELAASRAEAAALLGMPVDADQPVGPGAAHRMSLVDGAVAAHQGRAERSATTLTSIAEPGPLLAVPALVATGRLDDARKAATGAGPASLRVLAEAALRSALDPAGAVPLYIEAAEACERTPPAIVLPDTPHALGALTASMAGDVGAAEHLLGRALTSGVGGPVAVDRHRLLLAWVRLRSGRYDTAVAEVTRLGTAPLAGRERFLLAALQAGIARRSGDVARLRDAWAEVEPVLARRAVDLYGVEAVEELAVAATRLRRYVRVEPVLDALDAIVVPLGQPWQVAAGWIRLQVAIAEEDAAAAGVAAARLGVVCTAGGGGPRQRAQCAAAGAWARILAGDVDPDAAVAVGDDLAAAELPWEGSRLVGQAAIRTTDAAAARRLLERARDLSSTEVVPAEGRAESQYGGLSEREVEVARMVLAGDTQREIGARLFISPKTVEHHVARIRTKLGATSRAEFLASLRTVLGGGDVRQ